MVQLCFRGSGGRSSSDFHATSFDEFSPIFGEEFVHHKDRAIAEKKRNPHKTAGATIRRFASLAALLSGAGDFDFGLIGDAARAAPHPYNSPLDRAYHRRSATGQSLRNGLCGVPPEALSGGPSLWRHFFRCRRLALPKRFSQRSCRRRLSAATTVKEGERMIVAGDGTGCYLSGMVCARLEQ
jgi:hypothetical protein